MENFLNTGEIFDNDNAIINHLENLDDNTLLNAYNDYADQHSYERVNENTDDFLNETFHNVSDALKAIMRGNYSYNENYVQFDGYTNLESTDYLTDFITLSELIEHVRENPSLYDVEFIDFNDYDDEELFNIMKENRAFEGVPNTDEYSELWDREKLETVLLESDLVN